jgi:hypothetical protein
MPKRLTNNKPRVWTHQTVIDRCDEVGECLIWREAVTASGCPKARVGNVRNFIFVNVLGQKLPPGYVVQPKCGNAGCVAAGCLERITRSKWRQRVARVIAQTPMGLQQFRQRAVDAGFSKLRSDIAAEIRGSTENARDLAEKYGVNIRAIQRVRSREAWAPHSTPTSIFNLGA